MEKDVQAYIDQAVKEAVDQQFSAALKKNSKAAIIASKGTLDMAYPPLILASTCAALDIECQVFFTFYGLETCARAGTPTWGAAIATRPCPAGAQNHACCRA